MVHVVCLSHYSHSYMLMVLALSGHGWMDRVCHSYYHCDIEDPIPQTQVLIPKNSLEYFAPDVVDYHQSNL